MTMNIKSPQAHELVREIAALTGETQTAAVTLALQQRLDRLRMAQQPPLRERLLAIGQDCAAHVSETYRSIEHGELLYDERGLPRWFWMHQPSSLWT